MKQTLVAQGAEERGLFSVNLNKQSSYLNCYLKIITSNAYLISAMHHSALQRYGVGIIFYSRIT